MLPKRFRFPLRANQAIFRHSQRISGPSLDVYRSNIVALEGNPQASVVVGKNVSLKAVVRNHVKRVLADILLINVIPNMQGTIVVRAKNKAALLSYEKLKSELLSLVQGR